MSISLDSLHTPNSKQKPKKNIHLHFHTLALATLRRFGGWSGLPALGRVSTHGTRSLKNHSMKLANQMKIKTLICLMTQSCNTFSSYIKPNYISLNSISWFLYAYPSLIKLDGSQFTLASITFDECCWSPWVSSAPHIHIPTLDVPTQDTPHRFYTGHWGQEPLWPVSYPYP